jgi:hypothetical protein
MSHTIGHPHPCTCPECIDRPASAFESVPSMGESPFHRDGVERMLSDGRTLGQARVNAARGIHTADGVFELPYGEVPAEVSPPPSPGLDVDAEVARYLDMARETL